LGVQDLYGYILPRRTQVHGLPSLSAPSPGCSGRYYRFALVSDGEQNILRDIKRKTRLAGDIVRLAAVAFGVLGSALLVDSRRC
jgi:hypothetical protein